MDIKDKKAVVVGLGVSGFEAARLLKKKGAKVYVTEGSDNQVLRERSKDLERVGIKTESGGHTEKFIKDSKLIVVSPGVPPEAFPLEWAGKNKVPVISEIELAYQFCPAGIVAITGTNGKSTVTALTGKLLQGLRRRVVVCGNIGNPIAGELEHLKKDDLVVAEISSFQLERVVKFHPTVAVILNVTPDHLDRYPSLREYAHAKARIFENQTKGDWLVLNYDDKYTRDMAAKAKSRVLFFSTKKEVEGGFVAGDNMVVRFGGKEKVYKRDIFPLKGRHNTENVLACILTAAIFGIEGKLLESRLKAFEGLRHRFQTVAEFNGVSFVDDSKGTNIDAVIKALEACEGPVILIAGGRDKESPFELLRDAVRAKVKSLVLIGEASLKMKDALQDIVPTISASGMDEAVQLAFRGAKKGDIVLLSPACASFDMFENYKVRGEAFRQAVYGLLKYLNKKTEALQTPSRKS